MTTLLEAKQQVKRLRVALESFGVQITSTQAHEVYAQMHAPDLDWNRLRARLERESALVATAPVADVSKADMTFYDRLLGVCKNESIALLGYRLTPELAGSMSFMEPRYVATLVENVIPPEDQLEDLAALLNVDSAWLKSGKGDIQRLSAQTLPEVELYDPTFLEGSASITGRSRKIRIVEHPEFDVGESVIAMVYKGECMSPRFFDGDLLIVDLKDQALVEGASYLVSAHGEAVVRQAHFDGKVWVFVTLHRSARYMRFPVSEWVIPVGRVVRHFNNLHPDGAMIKRPGAQGGK